MEEENELDSMCGVSDEELTIRFNEAIRLENEYSRAKGVPIVRYDAERKQVYFETPDGTIKYAEEAWNHSLCWS